MRIKKCNKCLIAGCKRSRVLGEGSTPADILFIGEAPGKSEDLMGVPYVGPSGVLLKRMIDDATNRLGLTGAPSYFVTYMIQCRPYIQDVQVEDYFEYREPSKEEVLNCMPNLLDEVQRVKPKVVIFIGKLAEKFYGKEFAVHSKILPLDFLVKFGGPASPNYLSTVRLIMEAIEQI